MIHRWQILLTTALVAIIVALPLDFLPDEPLSVLIIGPFLTPVLVTAYGQGAVFALFMVILIAIALNVWALAEETKGRSLEELGEARVAIAS